MHGLSHPMGSWVLINPPSVKKKSSDLFPSWSLTKSIILMREKKQNNIALNLKSLTGAVSHGHAQYYNVLRVRIT